MEIWKYGYIFGVVDMVAAEVPQSIDDCLEVALAKARSLSLNFSGGNYRECVSAAYFIAESVIRCLLITKNLYARTHDGIRVLLAHHFVRTNQVARGVYNLFSNLYMRRLDADYFGSLPFVKDDVERYIGWVKLISAEVRANLPVLEDKHEEMLEEVFNILEACLDLDADTEISFDPKDPKG